MKFKSMREIWRIIWLNVVTQRRKRKRRGRWPVSIYWEAADLDLDLRCRRSSKYILDSREEILLDGSRRRYTIQVRAQLNLKTLSLTFIVNNRKGRHNISRLSTVQHTKYDIIHSTKRVPARTDSPASRRLSQPLDQLYFISGVILIKSWFSLFTCGGSDCQDPITYWAVSLVLEEIAAVLGEPKGSVNCIPNSLSNPFLFFFITPNLSSMSS